MIEPALLEKHLIGSPQYTLEKHLIGSPQYTLEKHLIGSPQSFRPGAQWLVKRDKVVDLVREHGRFVQKQWLVDLETTSRTKLTASFLFERRFQEEIERAQKVILGLQDNWDGQGSPGYAESTMDRAISFLDVHVKRVFYDSERALVPRVLPSDGGSIDLHWKELKFELLVNIPATDDTAVSFYAENFSDRSLIKGTLDHFSTSKVLIYWLTEASE